MLLPLIDTHTHSIASGHGTCDTITDMAKEASKRGLEILAITEHGPSTTGSCTESYLRSLKYAPRKRFGVKILYGCEINILDYNGQLDVEDGILKDLDINIVSLHTNNIKPGTIQDNTKAIIEAIKNPNIHIIGHPDDIKFPIDYEKILKEAMNHKVLLELNNSSLGKDGYRGDTKINDITYLKLCKSYNYPIIIGSDSHGKERIGTFDEALILLKELDFPKELIMNYNIDLFSRWLTSKRNH